MVPTTSRYSSVTTMPVGSVGYFDEAAGAVWIERLTGQYRRAASLNLMSERSWRHARSITMINDVMEGRMLPLTVIGIGKMTRELSR